MYCADRHQNGCKRSDHDSDQPDPPSPARPNPGTPLEGSRYFGWCRRMPAGDVQRGPHSVRIRTDAAESAIKLLADPGNRSIHNAGDLGIRDALEVAEHQHGTLDFGQLVVGDDDGTELFGHSLHPISNGGVLDLRRLQEGLHSELTQIGRRVD
jgi:hypothetical protein